MTILDQSLTKGLAIDDRAIDGDLVVVLEVVHEPLVDELVQSHLATNLGGPRSPSTLAASSGRDFSLLGPRRAAIMPGRPKSGWPGCTRAQNSYRVNAHWSNKAWSANLHHRYVKMVRFRSCEVTDQMGVKVSDLGHESWHEKGHAS